MNGIKPLRKTAIILILPGEQEASPVTKGEKGSRMFGFRKAKASCPREVEAALEAFYTDMFHSVLGVSLNEARTMVRGTIRELKKKGEEEGTASLHSDFGDLLLARARQGECIPAVEKARRDGAEDDDIREWWSMHDLRRRMVQFSEETFRYASFLAFRDEGFSSDEAMVKVRSIFPMYGDPDDTRHVSGDDRLLPQEIRGRVDRYRERHGAESIAERSSRYSTYNAFVRDEIRNGRL